jgi:hypothetical protein
MPFGGDSQSMKPLIFLRGCEQSRFESGQGCITYSPQNSLYTTGNAQFVQDAVDVALDGGNFDFEQVGNGLIAMPGSQQAQYLVFSDREVLEN